MYPQYFNPYQYQQQIQPQIQPNNSGFSCRSVSNAEEARTAQVPFDATVNVFIDSANNRIYTKAFDYGTGSFVFRSYSLEDSAPKTPKYITVEEFEEFKKSLRRESNERIADDPKTGTKRRESSRITSADGNE